MRNRSQTLAGISVANLKVLRYIINVQLLHPLGFHRRVQMRFCGARSRESRNYHPDSVIYQRLFRRVFGFWLKHFKLPFRIHTPGSKNNLPGRELFLLRTFMGHLCLLPDGKTNFSLWHPAIVSQASCSARQEASVSASLKLARKSSARQPFR